MYKILTVDDEPEIVLLIKKYFSMSGYQVLTACTGEEALKKISYNPDIILLDITMPGLSGLEICDKIRDKIQCPILFLTARAEIKERIQGLEIGADDYIIKPFDLEELRARIEAHIRREYRSIAKKTVHFFGELIIDYKKREVKIKGEIVILTKKEFDIVENLSLNAGCVLSREVLYENIWGYDGIGNSETVIEHIRKIRLKFAKLTKHEYIKTVWGCGYIWNT